MEQKRRYRGYLIDHHSPHFDAISLEKMNANDYEEFFKTARIDTLMVYCKDHWGYSYYNTKVGTRHPALTKDWIAELSQVLRKNDIEFNAYYCFEYDNLAPTEHPEWQTLKADGTMLRCSSPMARWKMPCYETGYRQYVLGQLQEIVADYKPDSLFIDIFGKSLCYCPQCKAKFENMYGYPLPTEQDELTKHAKDVNSFLDKCTHAMLTEVKELVKGINPDLKLTINFAALYHKDIRDLLDYQFTEPWAGNWLSAAYSRDTAIGQDPQLGPGDVSEVYNYKPQSIYNLATAQIAAQGCRAFMYSGSQRPDGSLEQVEAQRIGAAYREVERFEPYLNNRELMADVAIIQSDFANQNVNQDKIIANAIGRVRKNSLHRDALLGAMKMCNLAKVTWQIVPEQAMSYEVLKQYGVIILPSVFYISETMKNMLENYVKQGGHIISDAYTGFYSVEGQALSQYTLEEMLGVKFEGVNKKHQNNPWQAYLEFYKGIADKELTETYPPVMGNMPQAPQENNTGTKIEESNHSYTIHDVALTTACTIAKFMEPAVAIDSESWVNWWSPPPKMGTTTPAITINEYEKGLAIYLGFNFFNMKNNGFNWVDKCFGILINRVMPTPNIRLDTYAPQVIDYVCYDRSKEQDLIVHVVSKSAELNGGDIIPVGGSVLKVNTAFKRIIKAEVVYPCCRQLDIEEQDGACNIFLPPLQYHQIVQITYA